MSYSLFEILLLCQGDIVYNQLHQIIWLWYWSGYRESWNFIDGCIDNYWWSLLSQPSCGFDSFVQWLSNETYCINCILKWIPLFQLSLCRLPGDSRRVPLAGDRRPGLAAAEGGPPHEHHEHKVGARTENLCPHQHAQRLLASLSITLSTPFLVLSLEDLRWHKCSEKTGRIQSLCTDDLIKHLSRTVDKTTTWSCRLNTSILYRRSALTCCPQGIWSEVNLNWSQWGGGG